MRTIQGQSVRFVRLASTVPLGMVLFTACVSGAPKGGPMSAGVGGSAGSGTVPFGQAGMDGTATGTAGTGTGTAGTGDGGAMGTGGMGTGGTGVGAGGMGVGGTGTGPGGAAGAGTGGAAGGMAACTSNPADYQYPFQDPCKPLEDRVTNLLSLLTADEKVSLLYENQPAVSRLGLPFFTTYTEGLHGVGWSKVGSTAQSRVVATQFPQAFGLAQSWDSGGAPHRRRHDGRRVARLLRALGRPQPVLHEHRHSRARHRSRARSALGAHGGVLRRGPVPDHRAGQGVPVGPSRRLAVRRAPEQQRALPHGRVDAQALPRLQQRDEPQQERLGRRRPEHERVLPDAVSRGDQGGQGRRHHDLVQQDLRRSGDDIAANQEPRLRTMEVRRPGGHGRVRAERPLRRDWPQLHGDGLVA